MTQPPNNGGWQQPGQPYGQYPQGQPQYQQGQPQYPQGQPQYPQGQQFPPQQPGQPVPPGGPGQPAKKGIPLGAKIGAGAAALVLVGVGAFVAVDPLGMRANTETAKAAPADTIAYANINLNPGAAQQVEMIRFALKFPSVREKTNLREGGDPKQQLFESITKDQNCPVDYENQIKPWLGDQAGFALRRGAQSPIVLLAAKNEQQARDGIAPLAQCSNMNVAFSNGHLVLAEGQGSADDAARAADQGSLADQKPFTDAIDKLGGTGVASFWADGAGLQQAAGGLTGGIGMAAPQTPFETTAGTLRFTGGNPELTAVTRGGTSLGSAKTKVGDLPAETTMALGIAGGRTLVPQIMDTLTKAGMDPSTVAAQTGLQLPGDLETLLGDDLVIAADRFDPNRVDPTNPDTIPIGLAMDTDRAKLDALLAKFEQSGLQLTKVGDKPTYVSLSPAYAQKLSNPAQKLKDSPNFKAAVANAGGAQAVFYLDLNAFKPQLTGNMDPEQARNVEPLQSIGVSSTDAGDNWSSSVIRVTAR
ncbi:DUF3352 domain-containing protein [Enemella evansiae]|uniref:DUF3352 domain-containing protein n=1 Tax=Enemella evansiae TaxID=2016499 RepID=UPI00105DAFF4|nr:DUF3352 domain-containing protein [Enemella evansiae]TDO89453.1 uncharacterized protein DUF3352 [Enemella evansiae]